MKLVKAGQGEWDLKNVKDEPSDAAKLGLGGARTTDPAGASSLQVVEVYLRFLWESIGVHARYELIGS